MKILDRYIGVNILWGITLALSLLLALFSFVDFLDQLTSVGHGSYTIVKALEYSLLTTPHRAVALFPIAALLGALLGLGALAATSELRVVRTSGVSVGRLVYAVLKAALGVTVIAVLVGEVVVPRAQPLAQQRRASALQAGFSSGESGLWLRSGRRFVNIRTVLSGDEVRGISIYALGSDGRLLLARRARGATYRDGHWELRDVRDTRFTKAGVRTMRRARVAWKVKLEPTMLKVVAVKPEALSALALYRYIGYLRANGLDGQVFRIALWGKIVYPFSVMAMILLAVPLVLGRMQRVGVGKRMLLGALAGLSYHVAQQASVHAGQVYGLNPGLSAVGPTVVVSALALALLWRAR